MEEVKNTGGQVTDLERFDAVRAFCQAHADPAVVQRYSRYFREGYDAYGLSMPIMEAQRDLWMDAWHPDGGLAGLLELGDLLVASGKYEEAGFAILFLMRCRKEWTPSTLERLGRWFEHGICNWGHTDVLASEVVSRFLSEGIVGLDALASWRHATSRWQRRAVPVSLIKPMKGGLAVETALAFVVPMMEDSERVVHQGLGWFLREAWKRQPQPVESFLLAAKDRCARLVIQYATERMSATDKARFKRAR